MRFVTAPIILSSVLLLGACANKPLHDLDARRNSPDEFLVLPANRWNSRKAMLPYPSPRPVAVIVPIATRRPKPLSRWADGRVAPGSLPPKGHWWRRQAAMALKATFARH
jgi:hypothetical protein